MCDIGPFVTVHFHLHIHRYRTQHSDIGLSSNESSLCQGVGSTVVRRAQGRAQVVVRESPDRVHRGVTVGPRQRLFELACHPQEQILATGAGHELDAHRQTVGGPVEGK